MKTFFLHYSQKMAEKNLIVLEEMLSIYTYPFLSDASKEACVLAIKKHLPEKTFLIRSNPKASDAEIKTSLLYRYPVYYGKPIYSAFKSEEVERIMGISLGGVRLFPNARYGICGPLATTAKEVGPLWALHVWGVNLESPDTQDYKTFGLHGMPWYRGRCNELYNTVVKAGAEVCRRTGALVQIRIPMIGQGQFLKMAGEHENECRMVHMISLHHAWKKHRVNGLSLVICDYSDVMPSEFREQLASQRETTAYVSVEKDLFDVKKGPHTTLLVNAWDPLSFIGNGGLNDSTLDGFFVAGFGPGEKLPNSAYTHNPYISHHLIDPSNWIQ